MVPVVEESAESERPAEESVSAFMVEVDRAARAMNLPPWLLAGLIHAESNWDPNAVSGVGAMGLTQVMPSTARGMGYEPGALAGDWRMQIWAGARYLSGMMEMFGGNSAMALAAYNAGPSAVQKYGGVPPYEETEAYVLRVQEYASYYEGVFKMIDVPGFVGRFIAGSPEDTCVPASSEPDTTEDTSGITAVIPIEGALVIAKTDAP